MAKLFLKRDYFRQILQQNKIIWRNKIFELAIFGDCAIGLFYVKKT